jgi:4-hydroxybenzoate polyprenyltransferase
VLVAALALAAGAEAAVALALAGAMFGFQAAIGAVNDLADAAADRLAKPRKPIPAGDITPQAAAVVACVAALLGLAISAALGPASLLLGAAGLAAGLAYDLVLRERGLGWLAFSAALPLLLSWVWVSAAGVLPPGWPVLLPLAAVAGPLVHLSNGLVDLESDRLVGRGGLAVRLGRPAARRLLAILVLVTYGLAWLTLLPLRPDRFVLVLALISSSLAAAGVVLSGGVEPRSRELGWMAQSVALATLGVAWLMAAAA